MWLWAEEVPLVRQIRCLPTRRRARMAAIRLCLALWHAAVVAAPRPAAHREARVVAAADRQLRVAHLLLVDRPWRIRTILDLQVVVRRTNMAQAAAVAQAKLAKLQSTPINRRQAGEGLALRTISSEQTSAMLAAVQVFVTGSR